MSESARSLPRIPGYEIIEQMAGGGQASVFRGVQTSMNRPVAVKIIQEGHPDHAAEVGRFLRESRVLARLRHDNIVQAIDFGEHEGVRYLVMEFIEGTAVSALLEEEGHLGLRRSMDIAIQVCGALNHAASFGVIHRDIKPANIVMTPEGRAIVVDFGLARPEDSSMDVTRGGISLGTPDYMAPEQIKGETKLDHRVDIYALGGTLFHMLTGKAPFPAPRKLEILMRHLQDPLELPARLPEMVPARVFSIMRRAMAKDRDHRYRTALQMLRDLEAARDALTSDGVPRIVASRTRSGRGTASGHGVADAKAKRKLREASAAQEQLEQQNATLRRKSEEIRGKAKRLLEEKSRQIEEAEARAAEMKERLAELEARQERRDGIPGEEREKFDALARERDDLRERLMTAREAVDRVAGKAHEEKAALAARARELADQIRTLEDEVRETREKRQAIADRHESRGLEIERLRRERDELAEKVETMAEEGEKVRGESQDVSGAAEALEEERTRSLAERAALLEECESLREKLAAARREGAQAQDRTRQLANESLEARLEIERTRADLEARVDGLIEERDAYAERVRELASRPGSPAGRREAAGAPVETRPKEKTVRAPMVRIPAGFFIAGEDAGREVEKPRRRVRLHAFEIDVHPVTNRQFERFVCDGGAGPPDHWDGDVPPEEILDHPVVRVTWEEAVAYAAWLGMRLPTMIEWQRAARGTDGRSFPWGEHEDVSRLNCKEAALGGTTPVGSFPGGVSSEGVHEMAGNVTEWVHGRFAAPSGGDPDAVIRPVCGGSWRDSIGRSRCAARRGYPNGMRAYYVGFRCARDVS